MGWCLKDQVLHVLAHSSNTLLEGECLFVVETPGKAFLKPSLPYYLTSLSSLYILHAQGFFAIDSWSTLFNLVRSNPVTTSAEMGFVMDDSRKRLIKASQQCINHTPKRVCLVRNSTESGVRNKCC